MTPYAVHLTWLALGIVGFFLQGRRVRWGRWLALAPLIVLLGILAGTHSGGRDFANYVIFFRLFREWSDLDVAAYPEFGFQGLLIAGNTLGLSYGVIYSLFAIAALGLIALGARRAGANEGLFFFLYIPKYFFQGHINQIRSSLVYPFVVLSVSWLAKGDGRKVVLAGALLSTIHLSAALLILLPLMGRVSLNVRKMVVWFLLPLALSQLTAPLIGFAWELTEIRQLGYVVRDFDTVSLLSVEIVRRSVLFAMATWLVHVRRHDPVTDWICKMFLLSWVAYVVFIDIRIISDRLGALFGVVEPLLLLSFSQALVPRAHVLWLLLVVMLGVLEFFLRAIVLGDVPLYVPYTRL
jgi:hypothetical protein